MRNFELMIHYKVIHVNDRLWKVKREFPESRIKMIDGWVDILRQLYHADVVFRKDGHLFICECIDDVSYQEV